ncbi:MAG: D-serine ammonia-lyase [Tissierellia bacterium]|nr:D-serine ammonia-lyase [Tissierellia bacterium]
MKGRIKEYLKNPLIQKLSNLEEVFWENPKCGNGENMFPISLEEIEEAEARLLRFAPLIEKVFPETKEDNGVIESPLIEIPSMKKALENKGEIPGKLYLKMDSHLPIAGSIKARGGIYEVLKHTEDLAKEHGILKEGDSYEVLGTKESRDFFKDKIIQVGSTGNLGLSIGITSAAIGYQVIVHMSADAKQWKKDLLREKGVIVKEYSSDYSLAVKEGRRESNENPNSYFIDDENSKDLFLGYAVAAKRLKAQLNDLGMVPTKEKPLILYLPCGVGGAPGGVAYGCKLIFQDAVKIYFVEPTHAPCMLLGMATEEYGNIKVSDIGIDGKTIADGLAVGQSSGFVGEIMDPIINGIFTVEDRRLLPIMAFLKDTEDIIIEPSACSAFIGPLYFSNYGDLQEGYHIPWATGGALVPSSIANKEIEEGRKLKDTLFL